ncbi:type VI secretion system tip protein VgrG [Serratia sp. arafor3]|uniref:Type VI secretion system tip protein VgrG n=2 Tax=Serratia silvae TaxID=2824122 RepID=A0ABT0KF39_9GAMM|nr:type VI secretion system tip protein VgrG [Serratia silvae]MCL1030527.1 type VI secretion system tip protein VgrG [Serratia silvae]
MFADDKKNAPKGGVQPKNIVATETPSISGDQVVDMVGSAAGAVGGKAGKVVSQAADIAKKAGSIASSVGINPKNMVSGGSAAGIASSAGVKPMNFASGGSATAMASSAASALLGGAETSGLQFTLSTANLPPQTFVVVDFSLTETLSSPFILNVGLASADPSIDFAAVLDEDATLVIKREGVVQRSITGMVASFEQGDTGLHQTRYSMVIRPALWRTTLRRNARIFQQQSIENIITTLLKENGITDFAFGLRNPHPAREFCVQYQESDFDFIQRLAAEEGMFYYFEYPEGKNIVVYTDDVGTLPLGAVLPYNPGVAAQALELCVTTFTRSAQVRTAVVELKDYTFKNPQWSAAFNEQASELQNQRPDYEHFDFPGRFKDEQHGKAFTHYRLEALRNDANLGNGQSNDFTLQPGLLFTLTSHPRGDLNRPWQLLSIQHSGNQPQALEQESGGQGTTLSNQFVFLPHTQTWRPTPMPKPAMDGPQIAMVVGPAGEEIYCDEFGRIRLQFLWDRYGKSNDNSSCWIRVTQPWAGQGWGMLAIPRIGQEVVVDFLHGDPDQPIVTGRTYHANNIPPGSLPASKTQMAFRSKTHKGEGFNELRFEDAKGGEGLFMHAQKDMSTTVKDNQDLTVEMGNRKVTVVTGDEVTHVQQGNLKETIKLKRITKANTIEFEANADGGSKGTQLLKASDQLDLQVGESKIVMTTESITLSFGEGSKIIINSGGVSVEGPVVHLNKDK